MGISSSVGLVSGLQYDSIITGMVNAEKAPITNLQKQQATFQADISAYGSIKSALASLQTTVQTLKTATTFNPGYTATSSNAAILGVSVTDSSLASSGNYTITVNQLATSAQMTSNSYALSTSTVGTGVLQFKVGTGPKQAVTIDSSHNTLSGIAQAVNSANAGVTASVINVAAGDYRLSLTANNTGQDINYTFQETGLTFSTTTQAASTSGEIMKSQAFTSATTALGISGTLSVNGTNITLNGTQSLNNIRDSVNMIANVSASVTQDTTTGNYFLQIGSTPVNTTLALTYTANPATGLSNLINPAATVASKQALVNINGLNVQRTSNTITDLIGGISVNLASADSTKTVNVGVTPSYNNVQTQLGSFVDAYNKVVTTLQNLQSYDSKTKVAGTLLGDATANLLGTSLNRMIFSTVSGVDSKVNSLNKLGISFLANGQLQFNSSTFNTAITSNPSAVQSFFTQSTGSSNGFAVQMDKLLTGYTDAQSGIIKAKIDGYNSSSSRIDNEINMINNRADSYGTSLRKQFSNLENMLSSFQSTQTYLTNQLSQLSSMTSKF